MSSSNVAGSAHGSQIARVAHELTTPVSLISGSLENLQESLASLVAYVEATDKYLTHTEELARLRADLRLEHRLRHTPDLLNICSEGARRLSHVVAQLRSSASAPRGAAEAPTDLGRIIDAAVAMATHGRGDLPVLAIHCPPDILVEGGNSQPVGQVVLNVLRNALDALGEHSGGHVDITARPLRSDGRREAASAATAIISVRDNGPGIPARYRDQIFEEGFTTKRYRGGLGLGLAISREIMVSMGGGLELSPVRDGAEFLIEVPVNRGAETSRLA